MLSFWSMAIGTMAYRKKCREETRLHSVKIVLNESEEPVLLEDDVTTSRWNVIA